MTATPATPATLVLASHNAGKLEEFRVLLSPLGLKLEAAETFALEAPEETGADFEDNALLKARAACAATGLAALGDDSGLAVEALDGAPGIHSARWAGEERDFAAACMRVGQALVEAGAHAEGAAAKFVCALALVRADGRTFTCRGEVEGALTFPPRGDNGFGYDPVFVPTGHSLTFGEMEPSRKETLSHRARAAALLAAHLRDDEHAL